MQSLTPLYLEGGLVDWRHDKGASFSHCRLYRYTLWRRWSALNDRTIAFVGLNPSTADELQEDPTVRRCINFAKSWGFGRYVMLNIFAWRDTDPRGMKAATFPVGGDNDAHINQVASQAEQVICCWGAHGDYLDRGERVRDDLRINHTGKLFHLGLTQGGQPKHPLYLRADSERIAW